MTSTEVSAMLQDLGLSPDLRATLERLLEATLAIERQQAEPKPCACEISEENRL